MSSKAKKTLKVIGGGFPFLSVLLIGLFASLTAFYSNLPWVGLRVVAALLIAAIVVRLIFLRPFWKSAVSTFGILIFALAWRSFIPASNDREWTTPNAVLPTVVQTDENLFEVKNVRNFRYRSREDFDVNYEDRIYDLRTIKSVDFVISYWGDDGGEAGIAHTFLTFGFEGGKFVAISIEIRSENGESFHPVPGWFRQYELIYVVADERDVIALRTHYRREKVYLYPSNATPKQAKELFANMVTRADELAEKPQFYSSIGANCTTSLIRHLNPVLKGKVPFSRGLILNGLSDRFAYEQGYLIADLPFEVLKEACLIKTDQIKDDESFSRVLRESREAALNHARNSEKF